MIQYTLQSRGARRISLAGDRLVTTTGGRRIYAGIRAELIIGKYGFKPNPTPTRSEYYTMAATSGSQDYTYDRALVLSAARLGIPSFKEEQEKAAYVLHM